MAKGSQDLLFIVETREALIKLWDLYQSGQLLAMFQEGFVTGDLLKFCKADSIQLKIQIAEEDCQECLTKMVTTATAALSLSCDPCNQEDGNFFNKTKARTSVPDDETTPVTEPSYSDNTARRSDVKQTSLSGTFRCKFSVRTPLDKESPYINRMISMHDGRICVVDSLNNKIKLYTDDYVLCDKVRVPWCTAVTCVDDDNVAVATYYGYVTRYSVKENKITQTGKTLHIDGYIFDIAYRRGEFITRYGKHNKDYTCCGSKVIVKQDRRLLLGDCIQYDRVSDCVILCNSWINENTVTCYTLDGDVKWRVTLDGAPIGMVVVHGAVLVADDDNNAIRQITMDGRLLSTHPLTEYHGITRPYAITCQHKQHRLLVTKEYDKNVMVFNVTP